MTKVTGIGGIFFKCDDPKKMNEWYAKNLGLPREEYGTIFKWRYADDPSKEGPNGLEPIRKGYEILCAIGKRLYDKL